MSKTITLVQAVCLCAILLSCLAIGMGSWLETNNLLYLSSPSVSHHLSTFRVSLIEKANKSSTAYLSFGLWRYCIYNGSSNSNTCSSINLNFNIDTLAAINSISSLRSNQQLPSLPSASYVRVVPLILANFIGVVAFCIALFLLPGNNKKLVQRKALLLLNGVLCLVSSALTAVSFGQTFHQYSSDIKEVCSLSKSDYICQSYTPGVEIILLGLAVGLFCISSIYCIMIALSLNTHISGSCKTKYTNNSSRSFYPSVEEIIENQSSPDINEKQTNITPTLDESATVWNTHKERLSLRPPPPQQQRCRSSSDNNNSPLKLDERATNIIDSNADHPSVKPRLEATSSSLATTTMASTTDIKFTSSTSLNEDILRPPVLPFANGNGRSAHHKNNNRPLSYDSSNTFGAFYSSNPNSPSGDDSSINSVTSYMDHHLYQRSDSVTSHNNNSHFMYATSATGGAQSNHTLGTFPLHNTMTRAGSESYVLYNSSFEEDGESIPPFQSSSLRNTSTNSLEDDATSSNIPDQKHNNGISKPDQDQLHKRINDYRLKK